MKVKGIGEREKERKGGRRGVREKEKEEIRGREWIKGKGKEIGEERGGRGKDRVSSSRGTCVRSKRTLCHVH